MIFNMRSVMPNRPYVIRSKTQLKCLAAASRQEIFDVLEQMGTVSVAELAAVLGRPADALYFHLRALTRAGLVQQAAHRARSGRTETLYRTVKPEVQLGYEPHNAANRRAVSAIVASMLRLANRDFRRSFDGGQVVVSGAQRNLWAWRKVGRLSRGELARLNNRMRDLAKAVSTPRGDGRLYGVTVILTPLDHRNGGSSRATRTRPDARGRRKT
jgi:predicted ArsR family transcriptional regulator